MHAFTKPHKRAGIPKCIRYNTHTHGYARISSYTIYMHVYAYMHTDMHTEASNACMQGFGNTKIAATGTCPKFVSLSVQQLNLYLFLLSVFPHLRTFWCVFWAIENILILRHDLQRWQQQKEQKKPGMQMLVYDVVWGQSRSCGVCTVAVSGVAAESTESLSSRMHKLIPIQTYLSSR